MAVNIGDKALSASIQRNLEKAQRNQADALEKLSSGQVFTKQDPRPADRALAEGLEFKIRGLSSAKRNINDAVSLLQTAESSMQEITNMTLRMKEINVAAANTTMNDRDRRYLFVEYQALHDEVNRVAVGTEYNGIPLLNGKSKDSPKELLFRVGEPLMSSESKKRDDDINVIRFDGLKNVIATPEALGLKSARDLLNDSSDVTGISLEDAREMMEPEDSDEFATSYDQALTTLSTNRAVFGAMQSRLQRAMDYVDVYQENITAAKSHITDTDYAAEVTRLTANKILASATTSLMSHTNIAGQLATTLLDAIKN